MSLINEKEYDLYDYKPSEVSEIIDKKHDEYKDTKRVIKNSCPSCQSEQYSFAFDKYSFHYVQCKECMSLYVQNTLLEDDLEKYDQYLQTNLYSTDTYSNYLDSLSDKISFELELTFSRLLNKHRSLNIAYLGNKSRVYENALKIFNINFVNCDLSEKLENKKYDLVIIDHFIEKSNKLNTFVSSINSVLNDDGLLYITMRVGSGIDILTLWEDSKIYPVEHTNLLSIDGIKIILDKNEFIIKELNTPGVLDIENILETVSENIPKFLNYLKKSDNKKAIEEFQIFVQKNLLSSFATIIAKKGSK